MENSGRNHRGRRGGRGYENNGSRGDNNNNRGERRGNHRGYRGNKRAYSRVDSFSRDVEEKPKDDQISEEEMLILAKYGKQEEVLSNSMQSMEISSTRRGLRAKPGKPDNEVSVQSRPFLPPAKGVNFRMIQLTTNHFKFSVKEQYVYQYAVEFTPELESIKTRTKYIDEMKDIIGPTYVFDGAMLFLLRKLSSPVLESKSLDNSTNIKITLTNELLPGNISLQLCNLIFRKNILRRLQLKLIGRNYFDPKRAIKIERHKVQLWPGFLTAINSTEAGVMLIADITHKVLRTDTVLDFLMELQDSRNFQRRAEEQLVGQIVLTTYNNRTYRVDGIVWNMTPQSRFKKRTGQSFSYVEYYEQQHHKKLTAPNNQPLLLHKQRRKTGEESIYLIPELCSMTGITESMRSDNFVMKDISSHTRVSPNDRGRDLQNFLEIINKNEDVRRDLEQWQMSIDSSMLEVPGKLFDPERIIFKTFSQTASSNSEWSNMCKNSELLYSVPLSNWLLIYPKKNEKIVSDFSLTLTKVAAAVGFIVSKPRFVEIQDDQKSSYVNAISAFLDTTIQCVVCVLPTNQKDRYDAIKLACCVDSPVPSQCVLTKSIRSEKHMMSICNKIALQVNCKLGGELWRLEIPLVKTMLVGIDVYHDTIKKEVSVAGFCASYNASFTKYHSFGTFQKGGQELVDGLKSCMGAALRKFFEVNKFLPELIIVYRDGVGDGMLEAVVEHEIPQMIQTFESFDSSYKPRLAVIVVKKRIHARLFSRNSDSNSNSDHNYNTTLVNPQPGTVVDSHCVHKYWYDFFLVSQSVKQGTVTPTHYHVVYDTSNLNPLYIQLLTYKMCHLYYNWSGTIRVPAPCQYAHKYAYLVGQSLRKEPSSRLLDKLFYL